LEKAWYEAVAVSLFQPVSLYKDQPNISTQNSDNSPALQNLLDFFPEGLFSSVAIT